MAPQMGLAQKKPAAAPPSQGARTSLVDKARVLESRGRPDMAVQLWQQILLSQPNNPEALAGLAKDYKLMGETDKASDALDRLRRANPKDPNIAKIEALSSTSVQSNQLRKAGDLARQGRADEAMVIYRQLYGDHSPDGEIGIGYYQTLFGTASGKAAAIAGMRSIADHNPGDERAAVALGTMLTYDGKSRPEGVRILEAHPHNAEAQAALRQALIWDSANPASAAELREYLKNHPEDSEVAGNLKTNEVKLARMNSGIARTPAERAAFAALNAHRLDDAQKRFEEILRKDPKNGRASAGMGFLRMQQKNFPAAISFLDQAEQSGYKSKAVESALETSRFWSIMSEATQAMDENHLDIATAKFKAALVMNPRSPDALNGLAGLLTKEQQYPAAAGVYEQLIKVQPTNLDGWRGLFLAYARDNQNQKALATLDHYPPRVRLALERDPEYLRTLATIYQADGRNADAQRVLVQALALPFPDNGSTLKTDTKLQYAGILMAAKRYEQAAALYTQILSDNHSNLSAWMGLIGAHHEMAQDTQAIADVEKMPPPVYEAALTDSAFLSLLGAIYQQAGQFEVAQGLIERAVNLQSANGGQPSVALQLQLAGIYLQRNNPAQAYEIYTRILKAGPDRADAWKGLISTLLATNRNAEALQQIAVIPAPTRKLLENDIEFQQAEAGAYAANGDLPHAIEYMNRVQAHYAKSKTPPPPSIDVQNAWLLYNTGDDRALYPALMRLGGRTDLTVTQRETVQTIWANWSVRRAAAAMENGNIRRSVDILDAAAQAFPDNLTVRKAVAGGFARVGRAKESLALYKNIPMEDAASGDFQGAIGAALAANDRSQAELWIRQALERFPHDPAVLSLAARYEQARGDNQRAADYWRAALAAMPASSPTDKLAHELVYPEQDLKSHRAVTAADLQQLLNPDSEPFAKTTKIAPLPAYGADPYNTQAPLVPMRPQAFVQSPYSSGVLVVRDALYHPPAAILSLTPQFSQAQYSGTQAVPIVPDAPHSMASDAWKGLLFSLMAGNRNAEAIENLNKIPADIRRQLEADIEFVQGIASLYVAVGNTPHAGEYIHRVESYYQLHRSAAPAALEIQHAWLLYNIKDDIDLYPVVSGLDARTDLTADQRTQIDSLWATWAVRRAEAAMNDGNPQRGLQILQAASRDYPDNLDIRKAVAGAYARIGRPAEAEALFKTFPMQNATPADYQAAISAALGVPNMPQAETWLRQALGRYPSDPIVFTLAARFEQARGNSQRAAEYWRAALAIMPAASAQTLEGSVAYPTGSLPAPAAGDTKRLLDPRHDPQANRMPPLPAYPSANASQPPLTFSPPSGNPLSTPPAAGSGMVLMPIPNTRSTAPGASPTDASQNQREGTSVAQPVLVQQSWIHPVLPQSNVLRIAHKRKKKHAHHPATAKTAHRPQTRTPQAANSQPPAAPARVPHIQQQPMAPLAAEIQARFAAETDSQLTPAYAPVIRLVPNASSASQASATTIQQSPRPAITGQYSAAQYTPSAQDAATGAYSAPRKPSAETAPAAAAPSKPSAYTSAKRRTKTKPAAQQPNPASETPQPAQPTLANAPALENAPTPQAPMQSGAPYDAQAQAPASPGGLSDQDLQQRNLPPLRGPWVRVQREPRPINPREEAEMQLRSIESGYSAWMGGTGYINYRSGALGFDHLAALEAPFEASAPLGYNARVTVIAKPVFLDSGQADGSATTKVLLSSTSGNRLTTIPEPIGTLTATDANPPAQQNATGIGGELQLAFPHAAIAGGYTSSGFLVSTFTARGMFRPGNGPITINVSRDPVKDSQLSYAGLRDPAGNALGHLGQIWGGVVSNQGTVQYAHGDAMSGYYLGVGGQYLTGYNVQSNNRVDGSGGAYWRLLTSPEYGNLSIGVSFFAMHYANNQNAFTHGMGGYFSPQGYFLANVPFTYTGHYLTNWHYNVVGGLGVQAFQENRTPLFPLAADKALQTAQNNPMLPDFTSVGANYDLRGQVSYQISPHWFAGGFFSANNTRNYTSASAGFSVRYMFRAQPSTVTTPTGLFPSDGLRPFTVP